MKGGEMMNKKSLMIIVLLLLVGLTTGYVASTYAKYTGQVTGSGTATVAKWAFETDNATQTLTITLNPTVHASTLVGGKIAPGTTGSFDVALVNTTSEVGVDFTLVLDSITDKPTNLKFYKDNTYTTELTPGTTEVTGQLAAGDSTGVTVPIYWRWEYETSSIATNDPIDTQDGEDANTLTIGVTITGVQTAPSATAITSHVN